MRTLIVILLLSAGMIKANNTGDFNASPVVYGDDLPSWFFDGGIIGISDSNEDEVVACYQAVQRALAFYAISQNINVSSVYEYYYLSSLQNDQNRENQKSHWIADFETDLNNYSYSIQKIHRTKYNETIVLIKVDYDESYGNSMIINGSFMYHYDCLNDLSEYGEKQILTMSNTDSEIVLKWDSTIDNKGYLKKSSIGEVDVVLKKKIRQYSDYGKIDDDAYFCSNEFGLWNSYVDTFFQALSMFESNKVVVKNTTRQITQEFNGSYGDKTQNISRSVMSGNVSCRVIHCSFNNNCLYANWEIVER